MAGSQYPSNPTSPAERVCRLVRKPGAVEDACRFAELATAYCDSKCREAAALAATELAENLIKYTRHHPDPFVGTLGITVEGDAIRVRTENTVSSDEDAERVLKLFEEIEQTRGGARQLYRRRLEQLFQSPGLPRAQLGLLRLAYEGGFRLSARFQRPTLEVTAERPLRGPE